MHALQVITGDDQIEVWFDDDRDGVFEPDDLIIAVTRQRARRLRLRRARRRGPQRCAVGLVCRGSGLATSPRRIDTP